jgi:flagellar protein FlbD
MIILTNINGEEIYINPEVIETIEGHTNAIITLTTKKKIIVKEKPAKVKELFIEYKRTIFSNLFSNIERG